MLVQGERSAVSPQGDRQRVRLWAVLPAARSPRHSGATQGRGGVTLPLSVTVSAGRAKGPDSGRRKGAGQNGSDAMKKRCRKSRPEAHGGRHECKRPHGHTPARWHSCSCGYNWWTFKAQKR